VFSYPFFVLMRSISFYPVRRYTMTFICVTYSERAQISKVWRPKFRIAIAGHVEQQTSRKLPSICCHSKNISIFMWFAVKLSFPRGCDSFRAVRYPKGFDTKGIIKSLDDGGQDKKCSLFFLAV